MSALNFIRLRYKTAISSDMTVLSAIAGTFFTTQCEYLCLDGDKVTS